MRRVIDSGHGVVILTALFVAIIPFLVPSTFYLRIAALVFIFALAVVGLNLLMGFAGQVSLGHAGFFGIGAYAVAVGPAHFGIPSWIALIVGPMAAEGVRRIPELVQRARQRAQRHARGIPGQPRDRARHVEFRPHRPRHDHRYALHQPHAARAVHALEIELHLPQAVGQRSYVRGVEGFVVELRIAPSARRHPARAPFFVPHGIVRKSCCASVRSVTLMRVVLVKRCFL